MTRLWEPDILSTTVSDDEFQNPKTAILLFSTYSSPSGKRSALQTVLNLVIFKPDLCQIQPNGQHIGDFAK
jgi:hypothetical protein